MNTQSTPVFVADPGIPSSEQMACAMFPPDGVVVSTLEKSATAKDHFKQVKDKIVDRLSRVYLVSAIVHSGKQKTWKDGDNVQKRDVDGQDIPAEIFYQTSRSWYVICEKCKDKGRLFILAECYFQNDDNRSKMARVKRVFFHNSNCQQPRVRFHPNSCCITKFPFDDIIGKTYISAVNRINSIDITQGSGAVPYPINAKHINGGKENYGVDNRQYITLPDDELGIDAQSHKQCVWRILYYHASVSDMSQEIATFRPFFGKSGNQERIQEINNEHGHLTVDQVTCIFGQQDLRYRWATPTADEEVYPDPEDGGEICQVPHVDCPTGEERDLRQIMREEGGGAVFMPGTLIVPLHDSGRSIYGQSPSIQIVKIQKGEYVSFDGDWVHGGVARKPPHRDMCPALHIHLDSHYMGRRKETLDLDTRDVGRAIYLPKEHLPFRSLVSLMNVLGKRSQEMMETVDHAFDRFSTLETKQSSTGIDKPGGNSASVHHKHYLRSQTGKRVGELVASPSLSVESEMNGSESDPLNGKGGDSDDDQAYLANRRRLRGLLYRSYNVQLDVSTSLAAIVSLLGKPGNDMDGQVEGLSMSDIKALHKRAANSKWRSNLKQRKDKVPSRPLVLETPIRENLETATALMVLQAGGDDGVSIPPDGANNTNAGGKRKRKQDKKKDGFGEQLQEDTALNNDNESEVVEGNSVGDSNQQDLDPIPFSAMLANGIDDGADNLGRENQASKVIVRHGDESVL